MLAQSYIKAFCVQQKSRIKDMQNTFASFNPKSWQDFEPLSQNLLHETLTPANLPAWLQQGSELEKYVWEIRAGFKRARSRNIEDEGARQDFQRFTNEIFTPFQQMNHALKTKLLREMTWEPAPE